jgi:putative phage-type endonuclease
MSDLPIELSPEDDEAPEIVYISVPTEAQLVVMAPGNGMSVEERRTFIGGSDAAKALGESRWGDNYSLAEEKLGVRDPDDLSDREDVYFGTVMEAVVCQEYMRRTGRVVRRVPRLLRHPKYPWMGAHLDRIIIGTRGIIEAKSTKAAKIEEWGEPGSDEVPKEYFIQGQHNMACSDRLFCDYPVLFGGQRLLIYTVKRDETFIENMIRLEYERVWQWVERKELPPPETSEEANRRYPLSVEGEVQADQYHIEAVQQLADLKARVKLAEEHEKALELQIKMALGEKGDTLMAGTRKLCTWKSQKGHHVDAYDVGPSRVLRLTKQK